MDNTSLSLKCGKYQLPNIYEHRPIPNTVPPRSSYEKIENCTGDTILQRWTRNEPYSIYSKSGTTEKQHWFFRIVVPDLADYKIRTYGVWCVKQRSLVDCMHDTILERLSGFAFTFIHGDVTNGIHVCRDMIRHYHREEVNPRTHCIVYTHYFHILGIVANVADLHATTQQFARYCFAVDNERLQEDSRGGLLSLVDPTSSDQTYIDTTYCEYVPIPPPGKKYTVYTDATLLGIRSRRLAECIPTLAIPLRTAFWKNIEPTWGVVESSTLERRITETQTIEQLCKNYKDVVRISRLQMKQLSQVELCLSDADLAKFTAVYISQDWAGEMQDYNVFNSLTGCFTSSGSYPPADFIYIKYFHLQVLEDHVRISTPLSLLQINFHDITPIFTPPFDFYGNLLVLELPDTSSDEEEEQKTVVIDTSSTVEEAGPNPNVAPQFSPEADDWKQPVQSDEEDDMDFDATPLEADIEGYETDTIPATPQIESTPHHSWQ